MSSALVVLSGGQDSTTCLFEAKRRHKTVHAVTFNYGQRHAIELHAARHVAQLANVASHEIVDLGPVLLGDSPLTNSTKTLEQYAHHSVLPGGLEKTFVPGRNTLFFSLAANRAYVLGCDAIYTGICQEDNGGYPDCTDEFRTAMELAIQNGSNTQVKLVAPLMYLNKAQTVRLAFADPNRTAPNVTDAWHALAFSHTAYDGKFPPTGHDHANLLRAKGFEEACLPDPLVVRAAYDNLMEMPKTRNYTAPLVEQFVNITKISRMKNYIKEVQ